MSPPLSLFTPILWHVAPLSQPKILHPFGETTPATRELLSPPMEHSQASSSGSLVQNFLRSTYLSLKHTSPWDGGHQLSALCFTSTVKSQLYPVVSPCEFRWLQQSEKCLEFENPRLWASSCLVFFPWPGIYNTVSTASAWLEECCLDASSWWGPNLLKWS